VLLKDSVLTSVLLNFMSLGHLPSGLGQHQRRHLDCKKSVYFKWQPANPAIRGEWL